MSEDDPLNNLVMDEEEINRQRLSDALDGIIGIRSEIEEETSNGILVVLSGFRELDTKGQITAVLLGRKVGALLNVIDKKDEGLTSKDIAKYVDVADSTIRLYVGEKLSYIDNKKGYYIPRHDVDKAIRQLEKSKE